MFCAPGPHGLCLPWTRPCLAVGQHWRTSVRTVKGKAGGCRSWGTLPRSLLFRASQLEAQRCPDTLGRTVQWGAPPSSIPTGTNTYSKLPESAVAPRSPPRGCAEPGPGGKALIPALGRGPDPGSGHLGGDSHAVRVFVLVTGTFHDGYSSNLSPICVVLRLKGNFCG